MKLDLRIRPKERSAKDTALIQFFAPSRYILYGEGMAGTLFRSHSISR